MNKFQNKKKGFVLFQLSKTLPNKKNFILNTISPQAVQFIKKQQATRDIH